MDSLKYWRQNMKRYRFFKLLHDFELPNPNICLCSSDPPDPDPQIGAAALQNANIAQQQLDLGKSQLAYNQQQAAWQQPLIQKIAQQDIATSDTNTARANDQWNQYKTMFQPVENQMVSDAMNFDSPAQQEKLAGQAAADVTKSYQGGLDSNQRNMERMGINPNSGRFAAINNETSLAQAKDTAGAMNNARQGAITQGMALRAGVANFGRNMPNTGLAADSTALNAGNSAVGNIATGNATNNANTAAAQNWFGGATSASTAAGQLGLGQYQGQLNAWNSQNQNNMEGLSGIGSLVGSLAGAGALASL
jgi:hypothetical protein